MSRLPLRDAVDPTAEELARVARPLDPRLLDACRDALTPGPWEIARVAALRPRPRRRAPLVPALALALLVVLVSRALSFGPVDVPVGVEAALGAEARALGHAIRLSGEARLTVEAADRSGTVVHLEDGRARFSVDPDGLWRSLTVHAGETVVEVKGTVFEVERDGEQVRVAVERGEVDVRWRSETLRLRTGEAWSTPEEAATAASPAPVESISLASPEPPAPGSPEPPAPDAAVTAPAAEISLPPASPPVARAIPPAPAPSPPEEEEASVIAARAFASLLDLADREDPALLPALDAFLEAHPDGALADEAAILRLRALAEQAPAAAVEAAGAWLAAHPDHRRRVDVLRLHATVARDRLRDCALALPSYRELAPRSAEAAAWQGLCAAALGHAEEADRALRDALARDLPEPLQSRARAALHR